MKRTIEVKWGSELYYGNRLISWLTPSIRLGFGIKGGRYKITIVKGKEYRFETWGNVYVVRNQSSKPCGRICRNIFNKFFFKPDGRKRYDITVKKVK